MVNRLHAALAIVAALSAAAAGVIDRGPLLEGHNRGGIQTPWLISAPELADRIMRGDRNLRVFDLRPPVAFEQFHVPSARNATARDLADQPFAAPTSLVLYGDDRTVVFDALRVLRGRNQSDVRA